MCLSFCPSLAQLFCSRIMSAALRARLSIMADSVRTAPGHYYHKRTACGRRLGHNEKPVGYPGICSHRLAYGLPDAVAGPYARSRSCMNQSRQAISSRFRPCSSAIVVEHLPRRRVMVANGLVDWTGAVTAQVFRLTGEKRVYSMVGPPRSGASCCGQVAPYKAYR